MSDLEGDSDLFNDPSTSEEDDYFHLNTVRRKTENYLDETIPQYEKDAFLEHFRITRRTVQNMAQEFEQSRQYKQQSKTTESYDLLAKCSLFCGSLVIKQQASGMLQTNLM